MTLQQLKYIVAVAEQKSMRRAADALYLSQPSLSNSIRELEGEIGLTLFRRSNRGIELTAEGEEFLSYARQILEQYRLMEARYIERKAFKKKFSVSMQHYTFAVEAFIRLAGKFGMDEYEFAVHETKTFEVVDNVKRQKSELGIIYLNDFNRKALEKVLKDNELEFHEMFTCGIFVYLWKNHPLAGRTEIYFEELEEYPCLSFEQGEQNSFYFAEEVFSTREYKRIIKADDRATLLNLMVGLNGYTLCSGIICRELNGNEYTAVPLRTEDVMHIGYIKKKKIPISYIGEMYIRELEEYRKDIL